MIYLLIRNALGILIGARSLTKEYCYPDARVRPISHSPWKWLAKRKRP